jgi:hypothetical protein
VAQSGRAKADDANCTLFDDLIGEDVELRRDRHAFFETKTAIQLLPRRAVIGGFCFQEN